MISNAKGNVDQAFQYPPEEIRKLRGARSRAEFGRMLGVSALTVYRWELPVTAAESRRPRGRSTRALAEYVARALNAGAPGRDPRDLAQEDHDAPAAPLPSPSADSLAPLWPVFARLFRAEFKAVEEELFHGLAGGAFLTPEARALAAVGLACAQRWGRSDLRGAFATLSPHLAVAEAGQLPPEVAAWVHAMAAMLFAGVDGRLFDPGKVNAHVARAERLLPAFGQNEVRGILRAAELLSAFNLGEPVLIRRSLERARDGLFDAREPFLRCIAGDARANEAMVDGQGSLAARRFAEVAAESAGLGFHLMEARMHGFLGTRRLEEAQPPVEALALVGKGREAARAGGLVTGFWEVSLARVEGEALVRLARFDEALRALDEGERAFDELRWPAFALQPTRGRLCLYTGRGDDARRAGERLLAFDAPLMRGLNRAYAQSILASADWALGDAAAAAGRFDRALDYAQAAGGWMFLQRECLINGLGARIAAGDLVRAAEALRQAERMLERLPAAWWTALVRRHKGTLLCAQGRPAEGRQQLEGALATFVLAGDVPEAALTRRALALALEAVSDPDAPAALVRTEEELARAGMALPQWLRRGAFPPATPQPMAPPAPVDDLTVPFQRLSIRGAGPGLLRRELVSVARDALHGRPVRLEELDSHGEARVVAGTDAPLADPVAFEFGDGLGRRLRLACEGPLTPQQRAMLSALVSFAALSLENAGLRGFGEPAPAADAPREVQALQGFVAASPALKALRADLSRLSHSRSTVIITGESGSGKEVVARAIWQLSTRSQRPWVAFNCASVPRELFEGQLFGYRRGAFTGARGDHPGVLRAAEGGTVFLDEIGELPLEVQPKLLRFLENGEVFPLGETRPQQVDVRVIVATHRDLAQLVRDGRFREDLFYRLQVIPIRVPALRERPEDIVPLARLFAAQLSAPGQEPPALSPDALAALVAHRWSGNVRELRNVLERAMAFAPAPRVLTAGHLRIGG